MKSVEEMERLSREALDNLIRIYLEEHCDRDLCGRDFCYHISEEEEEMVIKVTVSFSDNEEAPKTMVIPFKTLIPLLNQALKRLAQGSVMYYSSIKPIGHGN